MRKIDLKNKEIPYGAFQSILLQSGLKESKFFEYEKSHHRFKKSG